MRQRLNMSHREANLLIVFFSRHPTQKHFLYRLICQYSSGSLILYAFKTSSRVLRNFQVEIYYISLVFSTLTSSIYFIASFIFNSGVPFFWYSVSAISTCGALDLIEITF
jgi:hypothetical protein